MRDHLLVFLVLLLSASSALGRKKCPAYISNPITATLDNGRLFSTCAMEDAGVRVDVDSLFDVLHFSERNFLIFCRSPSCIKPVQKLLRTIPTDCLINYRGSARNLSEEVSTLYRECAQVAVEADKTDEDYVYRYFLDS